MKKSFITLGPGLTQTGLYNYRRWLEAGSFGYCPICVAKTKALISCIVTAQLICALIFAYQYAKKGFLASPLNKSGLASFSIHVLLMLKVQYLRLL